jgi:hypothetical protein
MRDQILNLWGQVNRPGINDLINFMETSDFFEAPCSRDHHLAKVGGLAEHSLNVYNTLSEKCFRYSELSIPAESIIICGLAHDLCKVNYFKVGGDPCSEAQYKFLSTLWADKNGLVANLNGKQIMDLFESGGQFKRNIPGEQASVLIDWLKNRPKEPMPELPQTWSYDDKAPFGHGEKSVIILQQFIKLELFEALAIRWHMGAWDISDTYGKWAYNEAVKVHPLVSLLHIADMEATHIIEREKQ